MTEIFQISDVLKFTEPFDAVIFDLDDTLYSEREYVTSGYRAVAKLFRDIPDLFSELLDAFERKLPALDVVLERRGCSERKQEALQAYRFHTPDIHLYKGVSDLLRTLRPDKKLGLITDGRPEGQWAKIRSLGIETAFDCILVTDELGGTEFRKPNPLAFEKMCQSLNVPFERAVYVGDNPKKDFLAPEKLGMGALYFRNSDGLYFEK